MAVPAPARAAQRALGVAVLALPLAAGLSLPLVTSGRTAIPPFTAVGVAAAALCAAAALGGPARRFWDLPVAGLLGLAAGHLLFAPGLPRWHDLGDHLWSGWAFVHEIRGGDPFPRWLHHFGLGMPLLQFYGPLNFYSMLPYAALGLPAYVALKASFLTAGALAAVGMCAAVRQWTGDRRAGLAAAAAYAFAPYRLLDSNYRGALGESVALAILPWLFWSGRKAVQEPGRTRIAWAALAFALLVLAHPPSAMMAACGLAILVAFEAPAARRPWWERWAALTAIAALGLALAGFFVVPFAAEVRFTSLERMAETPSWPWIEEHGLRPAQLLTRQLWSQLLFSQPERAGGEVPEMPFYCGLVLLALLPLGAWAGRWTGEAPMPSRRLGIGLAAVAIASLALALAPGARLLARLPLLRNIQFSWRFLAIASFALAALAGLGAARLLARWRSRWAGAAILTAIVGLLLADGFAYTGAADWLPAHRGLAHFYRIDRACGRPWGCWQWQPVPRPYPERVMGAFLPPTDWDPQIAHVKPGHAMYFTPATRSLLVDPAAPENPARWGVGLVGDSDGPRVTRLVPAPYARWLAGAADGAWDEAGEARPHRRGGGRIEVDLDGRAGTVVVLEQFFPGWEAETADGWQAAGATREGLLRAPVAAGQRRLRLRFSGWRWDRAGGWLLTGLTSLALFTPRRRPFRAFARSDPAGRARRAGPANK